MALQPETVYEAVATGVSQGLFTVAGAAQSNNGWFADGKWKTAAQIKADKEKTEAAEKAAKQPLPEEQIDAPPKLKRSPTGTSSSTSPPAQTPKSSPTETKSETKPAEAKGDVTLGKPKASNPMDDPNRPILRHQAPSESSHEQTKETPEPLKGPLQYIPAISDAAGPDPRPYASELKPDEQEKLRTKMLAMAADAVRARVVLVHAEPEKTKAKIATTPEFHDMQMRVFDLSNTNEPVLVLTAGAHSMLAPELDFMVTLVARQDIYGDLHKVFAETTDNKHLDVLPRYDLIDAVDADGDGRGELLFRETWDSGSAFGVYRVIGDQLWPLFEGKPGT
jgi:hypothetical protein